MFVTHLVRARHLDPALQAALFETFVAAGDVDGLAALCTRPDLSPDVDARLGTLPMARVRVAWLNRPGRRPEERRQAMNRERRVTVLAALAAAPDLRAEDYAALAERESLRVLAALAANPDAPVPVRVTAFQRWARRIGNQNTWPNRRLVADIAASVPGLLDAVVSYAPYWVLHILMLRRAAHLAPHTCMTLMARLESEPDRAAACRSAEYLPLWEQLIELAVLNTDEWDRVDQVLEAQQAATKTERSIPDYRRNGALYRLQSLREMVQLRRDAAVALAWRDPDQLPALVERAIATRNTLLARQLCACPDLDFASARRLYEELDLSLGDLRLERREQDPDAMAYWLVTLAPYTSWHPHLARCSAPRRVLELVVTEHLARLAMHQTDNLVAALDKHAPELLTKLPPWRLAQSSDPVLWERVAARVNARIRPEEWGIFAALVESWDEGVDALLDLIEAMRRAPS